MRFEDAALKARRYKNRRPDFFIGNLAADQDEGTPVEWEIFGVALADYLALFELGLAEGFVFVLTGKPILIEEGH